MWEKVRETKGKESDSHVSIVDSQLIRTIDEREVRGYDASKNITGRKRHLAVDTMGLELAVVVDGADWQD